MKIGKLRYYVDFYTVTQVSDGEGGFTSTEAKSFSRYAAIRQLSQNEAETSGQLVANNNFEIIVRRYNLEVLSRSMLIKWNNRRMNITAITSDDYYHYINATERS